MAADGRWLNKIMISSESISRLSKVHGQNKCQHAPNVTIDGRDYILEQMFC